MFPRLCPTDGEYWIIDDRLPVSTSPPALAPRPPWSVSARQRNLARLGSIVKSESVRNPAKSGNWRILKIRQGLAEFARIEVAGDEDQAGAPVVAGPVGKNHGRMEQMLDAVDGNRLILAGDV